MIDIINWFTFSWLTLVALYALRKLMKGKKSSIYFIILVFYVFFGLPLFFEVFLGTPNYPYKPGFKVASQDTMTSVIYCLYVSIIPIFWLITSIPKNSVIVGEINLNKNLESFLKIIFIFLIISPFFGLLIAPDPGVYKTYAISKKEIFYGDVASFHKYIAALSIISVMSFGGILLLVRKNFWLFFILLLPFASLGVWLNGKRLIMVLFLLILFYVFFQRGLLKGVRLVLMGLIFILFLILYSFNYEIDTRYTGNLSFDTVYENNRVDYGRDDVTKLTIYSELNDNNILDFRGQSFLFYSTMYVPRELWPHKPWPYAIYLTATLMGDSSNQFYFEYGWTMTTSILEEAISNFGWLGMIIGPAIIALVCRLGDKYRNQLLSVLTIVVGSMFLVIQMTAFAPLFILWLFMVVLLKIKSKKIIKETVSS